MQISGSTQREYKGLNQLFLQVVKMKKHFESNRRVTYKQVEQLWGSVKKGEKWTVIGYRNTFDKEEEGKNGETKTKKVWFLKPYYVFNLDQTTISVEKDITKNEGVCLETAQAIVENFADKPQIINWLYPAYYPHTDTVQIPIIENFESPEEYYTTLFHELTHATGLEKRLNRKGIMDKTVFGNDEYSFEELVAETWAAYLSCRTGIEQPTKENSRAYIQGRLKALKNDKNLLQKASHKGRDASEYILGNMKAALIKNLE